MWRPNLDNRDGALYRAIADALAADIADGSIAPGTRLPTHRALADTLGVTVGTVTRAYAEAERRGLVDATVGRGTFVREALRRPGAADDACFPDLSPDSPVGSYHKSNAARAQHPAAGEVADLSANYPYAAPIGPALSEALQRMGDPERLGEIGGYQSANGRAEHRRAGARWLTRTGLSVDPDNVLVVPGAQAGGSVAFETLCRPGDTVLVEEKTWPGVKATAEVQGLRLVPVAMDADGLSPEALAEACQRHQPAAIYCMPTLHNPTNTTMPPARRRAIVDVAARHQVPIIEDDVYGFLHAGRHEPLAALAPDHVVHVTSLSKAVSPGLRLGYIAAPPHLVARLAAALRSMMLMTSSIAAECASLLIETGAAAEAAEAQCREAAWRQALAAERLAAYRMRRDPASFHLWLDLDAPWQTQDFAAQALARSVVVTPGQAFTVDGDPHGVRLCLCAVPSREVLADSLTKLGEMARARPESALPVV